MDLSLESVNGVLHAAIARRTDGTTVPSFEEAIQRAIADADCGLILEMDELTHIDCAGIRVILITLKHLHAKGAVMVLCCLPEPVRKLFKVSGFDQIIEIEESRSEAKGMVRSKGNGGEPRAVGLG